MLTRIKRRVGDDNGLTLIELLIAVFIVGLAVIAMSSTLVTSFAGVVRNETLVHATSVANEVLEELQSLPWNSLALSEGDVEAVADDGTFEDEDLVTATDPEDPLVPPARLTAAAALARGWRAFEVETYVTWVVDGGVENAYKRMTVVVTWEDRGSVRSIRVQGIRTPTPEEEAMAGLELYLTAVTPNGGNVILSNGCHPDDQGVDCGKYQSTIKVSAVATEPVGSVQLSYRQRGALSDTTVFMTYFPDRKVWESTIPIGRRFVNGETVFTVTTTKDGESAEAAQRVVFLHELDVKWGTEDGLSTPQFCVNDSGELLEPASLPIDVVGADVNMRGVGLPVFWANPAEEGAEPDGLALLVEGGETPWGGRFELSLSPGEVLWHGDGAAPGTVTLTVGPLLSALGGDPLIESKSFVLTVAEEGSC